MRPGKPLLSSFFLLIPVTLWAYGFSLAGLELTAVGYEPEGDDEPIVRTAGSVSARFIPTKWVNVKGGVSFELSDTQDFFDPVAAKSTPGVLRFDNASASFLPSLPVPTGITAFTGRFDDPSSDTLMREWLKVPIDAPEFHELPAGMPFSSESVIDGTGILVATVPGNANCVTGLYGYWNGLQGADAAFTGDARVGAASDQWRINAFSGLTVFPNESDVALRWAVTALLSGEAGNELYLSAGVRNAESLYGDIGRNLYFIFEPRLYWRRADLSLAFFSSPVYPENDLAYLPEDSVSNYLGANLLAGFGSLGEIGMRGGVSVLGSINPEDPGAITPFSFSVTPFYCMMVSDFKLTLSSAIKPFSLDEPTEAIEICVSLKAVY